MFLLRDGLLATRTVNDGVDLLPNLFFLVVL